VAAAVIQGLSLIYLPQGDVQQGQQEAAKTGRITVRGMTTAADLFIAGDGGGLWVMEG
jgi:hypothetical protein